MHLHLISFLINVNLNTVLEVCPTDGVTIFICSSLEMLSSRSFFFKEFVVSLGYTVTSVIPISFVERLNI